MSSGGLAECVKKRCYLLSSDSVIGIESFTERAVLFLQLLSLHLIAFAAKGVFLLFVSKKTGVSGRGPLLKTLTCMSFSTTAVVGGSGWIGFDPYEMESGSDLDNLGRLAP